MMDALLLFVVIFPFVAAAALPLVAKLLPNEEALHPVALGASVLLLGLSAPLVLGSLGAPATALPQVTLPWLPQLGISFALGLDGISGVLTLLTTLLGVLVCAISPSHIKGRFPLYYSLLFLLLGSVLGVFLARDLFLFVVAFELELIPLYLMISQWGGPRKQYAANKFVLYTLFGSIFLIISTLALGYIAKQLGADPSQIFLFSTLKALAQAPMLPQSIQCVLFAGFFIAFAVKLPIVPFHTWLPDAHVEAPTPLSMLLAGVLLKMGAYGLLRFGFEWFPLAAKTLAPYVALLALINIVYTGTIALAQKDMKKLVAYSSVSHMGFVLLAFAALNGMGFAAAVFIMLSHGLVSAALFLGVGVLYRQTHSRAIAEHSGVGQKAPALFYLMLATSLSSLGLPLMVSFAGESLTFYAAYLSNAFANIPLGWVGTLPLSIQGVAALCAFGIVLGAAYSLWLVRRVFFGPVSAAVEALQDVNTRERWVLGTLVALMLVFGFWPNGLLQAYQGATQSVAEPYVALLNPAPSQGAVPHVAGAAVSLAEDVPQP